MPNQPDDRGIADVVSLAEIARAAGVSSERVKALIAAPGSARLPCPTSSSHSRRPWLPCARSPSPRRRVRRRSHATSPVRATRVRPRLAGFRLRFRARFTPGSLHALCSSRASVVAGSRVRIEDIARAPRFPGAAGSRWWRRRWRPSSADPGASHAAKGHAPTQQSAPRA